MLGDDGRTYWLDFWWDDERVIGEADGLGKYRDRDDLLAEKHRQEALETRARAVVRWGMAQAVPDPRPMLERLRHALSPPKGAGWSQQPPKAGFSATNPCLSAGMTVGAVPKDDPHSGGTD